MSEELQQTSAQSLYLHADEKLIETIKNKLPTEEKLFDLSELFKVFGDSTRIKILMTLLESEMCVGDLANLLSSTQSAISHQLRVLKQSHLVKFRREGKTIFYSLADDHVITILSQGLEHVAE